MNSMPPLNPGDELDVRLTALLLGELPESEAALLRKQIAESEELQKRLRRLDEARHLVQEAVRSPETGQAAGDELRLSNEKRERLLAQFKTVKPPAFQAAERRRGADWFLPAAAVAGVMLIGAALLLPAFTKGKSKSMSLAFLGSEPSETASAPWLAADGSAPAASSARPAAGGYGGGQPADAKSAAGYVEQAIDPTTGLPAPANPTVSPNRADGVDLEARQSFMRRYGLARNAQAPQAAAAGDKMRAIVASGGGPSPVSGGTAQTHDFVSPQEPREEARVPLEIKLPSPAFKGTPTKDLAVASAPTVSATVRGFYDDKTATEQERVQVVLPAAQPETRPADSLNYNTLPRSGGGIGGAAPQGSAGTYQWNMPADAVKLGKAAVANGTDGALATTTLVDSFAAQPAPPASASQVPVLGDVPVAGRFFRQQAAGLPVQSQAEVAQSVELRQQPATAAPTWGEDTLARTKMKVEALDESVAKYSEGREAQDKSALAFGTLAGEALARQETVISRDLADVDSAQAGARGRTESAERFAVNGPRPVLGQELARVNRRGAVAAGGALATGLSSLEAKPEAEKPATTSRADSEAVRELAANKNALLKEQTSLSLGFQVQTNRLPEVKATFDAAPKAAVPKPEPQAEVVTRDNPFSTFSLNVSDVSFKLAATSLENGALPEPGSIRSEEFINAFDYRDPEPAPGLAVTFTSERATYPFALNRDVLRFSVKTAAQGRQAGKPINLVLLLDNSGSMERSDRVRIIRESLRLLASQLQAQDKFSVVTFSRTATLRVDGRPGNEAREHLEELAGLTPEGGTNLEEALRTAYETALRHYASGGINRVVLLTDGAANLGEVSADRLKQMVEGYRKRGVALDAFGIGWDGLNDVMLEALTRNGDGRYAFLNSPEEAASEFVARLTGALRVAAADVKVQVEFNPSRVNMHRQVGYAKHQLTKEQFRDNTVDAAEIGAAEAGNGIYLVEINPAGTGPIGVVRVRYKDPNTGLYNEREWPVPYNGTAPGLNQSNPSLRLAAVASAFSETLAQNPYAAEVTSDALLSLLSGVPEVYGTDPRPKKLEWMIRQTKSLTGK